MRVAVRKLVGWLGDKLVLNALAVFGALIGLVNALMAWRLFGTGQTADLWMMALAVTQALVLLSQLGVEQVAVFSAEARSRGDLQGRQFDRDALLWSILYGVAFSAVVGAAQEAVVAVFAMGFPAETRQDLRNLLRFLLLQVAAAPCLFVLRQQLLLNGRTMLSVTLNNTFAVIQCVVLGVAWYRGVASPLSLAQAVGPISAVIVGLTLLAAAGSLRAPNSLRWYELVPFIRASVALRLTHSVHNFLVVILTNAALSAGVSGTVAVFQYVKKVADGLASVSIGPHLSVYHAAQARAWTLCDRAEFVSNVRRYLMSSLTVLLVVSAAFVVGASTILAVFTDARLQAIQHELGLLVVLLCWQLVIAVESIAAGILVVGKRAGLILAVNGLYVIGFFIALHWVLPRPYGGVTVGLASLACQMLSFALFSVLAARLFNTKVWRAAHA